MKAQLIESWLPLWDKDDSFIHDSLASYVAGRYNTKKRKSLILHVEEKKR